MQLIPLTQGFVAKVDDSDYEFLNQFKWCANSGSNNKTPYAVRGIRKDKICRREFMHRVIAQAGLDEIVDHINHDTLDNRRENLRVGTQALNSLNRIGNRNGTSIYKGVGYYRPTGQWHTTYRSKHIGFFDHEQDAARAYNAVASRDGQEWAYLNEIPGLSYEEAKRMPECYRPRKRKNQYKGVRKRTSKSWEAYIQFEGNRYVIGYSIDEIGAVQLYNNECDRLGIPHKKNQINSTSLIEK